MDDSIYPIHRRNRKASSQATYAEIGPLERRVQERRSPFYVWTPVEASAAVESVDEKLTIYQFLLDKDEQPIFSNLLGMKSRKHKQIMQDKPIWRFPEFSKNKPRKERKAQQIENRWIPK